MKEKQNYDAWMETHLEVQKIYKKIAGNAEARLITSNYENNTYWEKQKSD